MNERKMQRKYKIETAKKHISIPLQDTTGHQGWLRGPAVEHRSLAGVLSLSCVRLVADG